MTAAASTADIRHWARSQGITVGDRGRLAPGILTAYAASHSSAQEQPAHTAQTPQAIQAGKAAQAGKAGAATSSRRAGSGARVAVRPVPGATGTSRTISARTT